MLARVLKRHPCELRADFQQYYGLCLDGIGRSYSHRHAADLVVMLPRESRVMVALNPANAFGAEEILSTVIANGINDLVWLNTKDAEKGKNRPKRILPPGFESQEKQGRGAAFTVEEYERHLRRPRGRVNDGD